MPDRTFRGGRVGAAQKRRLALTGEQIDDIEAHRLVIAHFVAGHTLEVAGDAMELEMRLAEVLNGIDRRAPKANTATREIISLAATRPENEVPNFAAAAFASAFQGGKRARGRHRLPRQAPPP